MEMSQVTKCRMSACAYNVNNACHTPGISVGPHAQCNTYITSSNKGGFREIKGGVGACIASDCKYNEKLECKAQSIDVEDHDSHADCHTFETKK